MPNKYCHECGNELIENAKFCSSCAAAVVPLSSNTPTPAPTPAVTPTPTSTPASAPAPEPTLTVPVQPAKKETSNKQRYIVFTCLAVITLMLTLSFGRNAEFGLAVILFDGLFAPLSIISLIILLVVGIAKLAKPKESVEAPEILAVEPVPAEKTEMEAIEKEPDYSWDLMAPTPKNEVELANKSKDEKPSEITDAEMEKEQLEIKQWENAFKVGGFIFTALIGVVVFAALIGTCSSVPQ